jgi:hypothetical protein
MEAAVWGLLGTIVGALASIGTAWIASRASSRLEREKMRLERVGHARDFQLQTLIDLQDAICEAIRLVGEAHLEDMQAYQKGHAWGESKLSEKVNEDNLRTRRKVLVLIERVSDDYLRASVATLLDDSQKVPLGRSLQESEAALRVVATKLPQVLKEIGTVLRSQYEPMDRM